MKIFYSWQSDLPNRTNRGFIEEALEKARKAIGDDDTLKIVPVIDRDTNDVPGAPDISSTILSKIDDAQIFVCDITLVVGNDGSRRSPNPNVLFELGYAFKCLGPGRLIMVFNTAYGRIEDLPFDLRTRRVTKYSMEDSQADRATERNRLGRTLEEALRNIIAMIPRAATTSQLPTPSEVAQEAIRESRTDQAAATRNFMSSLIEKLEELAPDLSIDDGQLDEKLFQSIIQTENLAIEFAYVAKAISEWNAEEAGRSLIRGFSRLLEHYNLPKGVGGTYLSIKFDFYKFIGHELYTISSLI